MSEDRDLRRLKQAQAILYRMLEERLRHSHLEGEELQEQHDAEVRDQRTVVAFLRAEYTGRLFRERSGEIQVQANHISEDSGPEAPRDLDDAYQRLAELRAQHVDALNLLWAFKGWEEVVKRYECGERGVGE